MKTTTADSLAGCIRQGCRPSNGRIMMSRLPAGAKDDDEQNKQNEGECSCSHAAISLAVTCSCNRVTHSDNLPH